MAKHNKRVSMFDPAIVRSAIKDSVVKLGGNPYES
jgi:hypothetical protein